MLLFHILHFIVRMVTKSIRSAQKYKQKSDSECQCSCRWSGSECEEGSSRWSNELPDDILQNVLQRLCLSEIFQCSAVCVSWKAIVDRTIASKSCRPTPDLPWLVLCSHPFSVKDNCFLCLYDNAKLYDMPASTYNMKRGDCVGSIEGWLIMADSVLWRPERFMKPWSLYLYDHQSSNYSINFFFLNPLTGARVTLPSSKSTLPCHCSNKPGFFLNVTASSVPTSHNCFVVSLCKNGHLAFCSPTQESWTLIDQGEARGLYFRDIEIIDGKIYAATTEASKFLMVFDVEYGNGSPSYRAERPVMLEPSPAPNMFIDFELISLAKDSLSEELFLIFCRTIFALEENPFPWHEIFGDDFGSPLKIQAFRVLKMEWKVNGPQWILFVPMAQDSSITDESLLVESFHTSLKPGSQSLILSAKSSYKQRTYKP